MREVTGGQALAEVLVGAGVRHVIGLPGGTNGGFVVAVGDHPDLHTLVVRHEVVATFAADAYNRVSDELMAVILHGLPGAANAIPGIAAAFLDSSAMVVVTGEIDRATLGRGAIHDLMRNADGDVAGLLRHVTKRVWVPHSPGQLVEQALKALRVARTGRPGPTAITVSSDILDETFSIPDRPIRGNLRPAAPTANAAVVVRAAELLGGASRPVIVAGNGVKRSGATAQLVELAELVGAPVATTVSGKGAFPETHPLSAGVIGWVGTPAANWAGRHADAVMVVGARLTDTATGAWKPGTSFDFSNASLIQVDIDGAELANVYPVDVPVVGDARTTLADLTHALSGHEPDQTWCERFATAATDWRDVRERLRTTPPEVGEGREPGISVGAVVGSLRSATASGPINLLVDIGNHAWWLCQQFELRDGDRFLANMGAGIMGFAPAGSIGAALADPERRTVAWVGDGGMAMALHSLPTLAEYRLPVTVIVLDNGGFSSVAKFLTEQYQQVAMAHFDAAGDHPGYRLDLVAVAEGCGVPARRVTDGGSLDDAMAWATSSEGPTLLVVDVDPESHFPVDGGPTADELWAAPDESLAPWMVPPVGEDS